MGIIFLRKLSKGAVLLLCAGFSGCYPAFSFRADDSGDGGSGGGNTNTVQVVCDTQTCTDGAVCCYDTVSLTYSCSATGCSAESAVFTCDGTADCAGQQCCYQMAGTTSISGSTCEADCGSSLSVCTSSSDCDAEAGEACELWLSTFGYCAHSCCSASATEIGCADNTIESCVCAFDSYCCTDRWDETCVSEAKSKCGAVCE